MDGEPTRLRAGGPSFLVAVAARGSSRHMRSSAEPTEDSVSALCVVLDCGPSWAERAPEELSSLCEQLLVFLNAYSLLAASNLLLLLGAHPAAVHCLWPPASAGADAVAVPGSPIGLRDALLAGVHALVSLPPPTEPSPPLPAALSAGLCRLLRAQRSRPRVEPRLLVVHATEDAPSQHLAVMNCAFAAQKLGVLIDAVVMARADSMVLQQATHLTGGLYLRPEERVQRVLAQYLISSCLPDRYARQFLRPPPQGALDTRAICALSQQQVEMGWACSVCLHVFEHDKLMACPVCGTRFTGRLLAAAQAGGAKKRPKKSAAAAATAAPAAAAIATVVTLTDNAATATNPAGSRGDGAAAPTFAPPADGRGASSSSEFAPWQTAPRH